MAQAFLEHLSEGRIQAFSAFFMPAEEWDLEDPKGQALEVVHRIRDQIRARVEQLVEELQPAAS